jgi:hypothetical protein
MGFALMHGGYLLAFSILYLFTLPLYIVFLSYHPHHFDKLFAEEKFQIPVRSDKKFQITS